MATANDKTAIVLDEVFLSSNSPLPVELTAFEALRQTNAVLLKWATASEKNNDRFEVERSADGQEFRAIGTVAGHGSTTQAQTYALTDRQPLSGLSYYRLRQVDTEGAFSYSPVRVVATGAAAALYPNPAQEDLHLPTGSAGQPYQVLNLLGQLQAHGLVPNNETIGLGQLRPGSYMLLTGTGISRTSQRFQRQ
ncbi:T9SS type A sorting domain-containing protein [Hymenobacter daecheongensis]|uniref:T9SS type A sorting domain-containing protein n=1 Tax=Hymenobacter daecheongensis TaxID=496053 RepID=UPI00135647AD|nr:T9SS type A sorting domain-containing protein [Hymenobacter daecheongensis]